MTDQSRREWPENERKIKAMLVMLAEYLQTTLSDVQIRAYAHDLLDVGPEGLAQAIRALKADPAIWAGRFPLPGKLKSYLSGSVEDRAAMSARRILEIDVVGGFYNASLVLSPLEYEVAKSYGLQAIYERGPTQTPTVYAQLRDMMAAAIRKEDREKSQIALGEARGEDALLEEATRDGGSPRNALQLREDSRSTTS